MRSDMRAESREVDATVRSCESYWKRTGVPRSAIPDMRMELQSHLREAVADGKSLDSVVGDEVAFAEEWAREFRAPMVPIERKILIRAAMAGVAVAIINGLHFFFMAMRTYSVRCCPRRVVEVYAAWPEILLFWLTLVVAVFALAGSVSMAFGRPRLAAFLWGVVIVPSLMTPGTWVVTILLVLAVLGARKFFTRPLGTSRQEQRI